MRPAPSPGRWRRPGWSVDPSVRDSKLPGAGRKPRRQTRLDPRAPAEPALRRGVDCRAAMLRHAGRHAYEALGSGLASGMRRGHLAGSTGPGARAPSARTPRPVNVSPRQRAPEIRHVGNSHSSWRRSNRDRDCRSAQWARAPTSRSRALPACCPYVRLGRQRGVGRDPNTRCGDA